MVCEIGSIHESCVADETKQHVETEIPCGLCQGEAIHTGQNVHLCETCRDRLASLDLMEHDIRMAALRVLGLWRKTVAGDTVTPRDVQFIRDTLDKHLAAYLPQDQRQQYQTAKEIAA